MIQEKFIFGTKVREVQAAVQAFALQAMKTIQSELDLSKIARRLHQSSFANTLVPAGSLLKSSIWDPDWMFLSGNA